MRGTRKNDVCGRRSRPAHIVFPLIFFFQAVGRKNFIQRDIKEKMQINHPFIIVSDRMSDYSTWRLIIHRLFRSGIILLNTGDSDKHRSSTVRTAGLVAELETPNSASQTAGDEAQKRERLYFLPEVSFRKEGLDEAHCVYLFPGIHERLRGST